MSKLIDELKQEHAKLLEILNSIKRTGIATEDGRNLLLSAKKGLLEHLAKEDKFLYPPMRQAAATDASLKGMLETFAADMDAVSKVVMDFFAKYTYAKALTGVEFSVDLGKMLAALKNRISREESILYPAFEARHL